MLWGVPGSHRLTGFGFILARDRVLKVEDHGVGPCVPGLLKAVRPVARNEEVRPTTQALHPRKQIADVRLSVEDPHPVDNLANLLGRRPALEAG
jgi:hypothetical protein